MLEKSTINASQLHHMYLIKTTKNFIDDDYNAFHTELSRIDRSRTSTNEWKSKFVRDVNVMTKTKNKKSIKASRKSQREKYSKHRKYRKNIYATDHKFTTPYHGSWLYG